MDVIHHCFLLVINFIGRIGAMQKKMYTRPTLRQYGSVQNITLNSMNGDQPDVGGTPTAMFRFGS